MPNATELAQVEEIGKRVEEWLVDEGFSIWKSADKNCRFSFKVTRDDCLPLFVLQPRNKVDSLLVVCDTRLTDEGQKRLSTLPEKERGFMLFDLRTVLLSTACRWQFIPSLESWKTIRVSKAVFYDGLTKDRFFETVDTVARAVSLVILSFQWKFGITPYVS
jgi:hypothetical protein